MTETLLIALLATIAPTLAVVVSGIAVFRQGRKAEGKMEQIHVLVNSRLTEALTEIALLKRRLGVPVTIEESRAATTQAGEIMPKDSSATT